MSDGTALIQVVQLPIIAERLQTLKPRWEQRVADAEAMVCTEETVRDVKAYRADMRKECEEVSAQFNQALKAVMEPINRVKVAFRECVTEPFNCADSTFKRKISDVESEIKRRCEDGLREYFAELCAAYHVEWLQYEQAEIKVDMASAKQKTSKRLKDKLFLFVADVSASVERIMEMDSPCEVMAEYKRCLNLFEALSAVQDRHRRIEAEHQQMEQRAAQKAAEDATAARVEALAPPAVVEEQITVTFTVTDTKERLIALRKWMKGNGYKYECG